MYRVKEPHFTINDYLQKGGFIFIQNDLRKKIDEFYKFPHEEYKTKNGTILTSDFEYYSLELLFNSKQEYYADQLEFFIESVHNNICTIIEKTEINFFRNFKNDETFILVKELYKDDDEIVAFLQNGVNLHFIKSKFNDFIIKKITSFSHINTRDFVKKTLQRVPL